jgi:hypothetical protein
VTDSVGVLFVHGIGTQARGSTLNQFGDPLLEWLRAWSDGHGGNVTIETIPEDPIGPRHLRATWTHPRNGITPLVLAECWWADAFVPPSLGQVLRWAPGMAYRALWRLILFYGWLLLALLVIAFFIVGPYALILSMLAAILMAVSPVVGIVVYVVLMIFPFTRGLARGITGWLADAAGDAWVLTHSETGFAAMRGRFATELTWLQARVGKIVVAAHSQGSVVAVGALNGNPSLQCDVLVTLGSALRLLRLPGEDAVIRFREVHPTCRWINIYSQLDPVASAPSATLGLTRWK